MNSFDSLSTFQPIFFRLHNQDDLRMYDQLVNTDPSINIYDEMEGHLRELIKSLNPSRKIKAEEYDGLIKEHLGGQDIEQYGVWIYYPWSKRMVHCLDEEEFVEVRTNRNRYKITREEQETLRTKKIGIIGLSVGQSITLTLAMERTCGELRLADFDIAELSNLNRIRTGIHNLGLKKTIIAAREVMEIDPFIKIKIFSDGLTKENMDDFFTGDGKLDIVVEVCDGLDIKIESRFKAKELSIPVVMDTNDRGMLDVERFDLEPDRPILHGLAGDLDPANIKDLTNEEKIPYILKMVGAETLSTRMKASMMEVEQTINTWPQLASSVVLGGALTTDVCRRILLDQYHDSGRYYIDLDELVGDKNAPDIKKDNTAYDGPSALSGEEMKNVAASFSAPADSTDVGEMAMQQIVKAAMQAPSGGNAQPWRFLYSNKQLFVFHDEHYSYSLLDYNNLGSYVGIGAALENIAIKAASLGYAAHVTNFPGSDKKLVALISFSVPPSLASEPVLEKAIYTRLTNRNVAIREQLPDTFYNNLKASISQYKGAQLDIIDDDVLMRETGEILATTEMLRIIHPRGHYDTFTKELRWTAEEAEQKRDGLDVDTLGVSRGEAAAFKIAEDDKAIDFLRQLHGGYAFKKMVRKAVAASSALGVLSMPSYSNENFLEGGRAMERIWLTANSQGISFQPIAQFVFMDARLQHGNGEGLGDYFKTEFERLKKEFYLLNPYLTNRQPVFIFRLCKAGDPKVLALRKNIESVFTYI